MTKDTRYYEFPFVYFKRGDDLGHQLESHKDADNPVAAAFTGWAEQLEYAASLARRFAGVAADLPGKITVDAGTHMIRIAGPRADLDRLLEGDEPLLEVDPFDEYEEDDGGDESEDDGEDGGNPFEGMD